MAMLQGEAEEIFKKAARESPAGSEWEKLFSGLADLAGDVGCVMGDVARLEGDLRKTRGDIDDIERKVSSLRERQP